MLDILTMSIFLFPSFLNQKGKGKKEKKIKMASMAPIQPNTSAHNYLSFQYWSQLCTQN